MVQLRQNKHTRTYTYGFLAVCCCRPSVLLNRDSNTTLSVAKCYEPISVTLVENKIKTPERKGSSYDLLYGQLRHTEIDQSSSYNTNTGVRVHACEKRSRELHSHLSLG